MKRRQRFSSFLLSVPVVLALATPALADRDHDWDHRDHGDWGHHHDFHGRDFHHFSAFELELWRGGRWHHDWHDGRFGWWWETDGIWYWYPEPIYPYPTYVAPAIVVEAPPPPPPAPVVIEPPPPPPPVVVEQPPPPPVVVRAPPPPPSGQPPAQFWYYCDEAHAYYPYVASCSGPWRQVPAASTTAKGH